MEVTILGVSGAAAAVLASRALQMKTMSDDAVSPTGRAIKDSVMQQQTITIDDNDEQLLRSLAEEGGTDAKVLQFLEIHMEIKASLRWWKQFDACYLNLLSVGIDTQYDSPLGLDLPLSRPFEMSYFEEMETPEGKELLKEMIPVLNQMQQIALENSAEEYPLDFSSMIPLGFLQTRFIHINYVDARRIYLERNKYRLPEWSGLINAFKHVPYGDSWIFCGEDVEVMHEAEFAA